MARRLTTFIFVAMLLGIIAGHALHQSGADAAQLKSWADGLAIVTDIFLRLIKMIIAPLVFSTLVVGIAHMGDSSALGRIGFRSLLWFIGASFLSLSLGIIMVTLLEPGVGSGFVLPPADASSGIAANAISMKQFITHLVPKSVFEAMAGNEILQIVVFSLFMGVALTAVGEAGKPFLRGMEALVALMLQITNYVMRFSPLAVFAAIASVIAVNGLGVLLTYVRFVGGFYLSLAILWVVLLVVATVILGVKRGRALPTYIRQPVLLAFSTASSEAAYPKTLEQMERFGVPKRIGSFVLPLGYSFNLDGSMMYCTFATLFIAQLYGVELSVAEQLTMLLLLMVTSKGMAGVPRASLVVIAATLAHFNIPEGGLVLILAVDHFLDMGRAATNVVGNAVATSVIARWEGMLQPPWPADMEEPHAPSHSIHEGARGLNLDPDMVEDRRTEV